VVSYYKLQAAGLQNCVPTARTKRETSARAPSQLTGDAANIELSRHNVPLSASSVNRTDGDADSSIQPPLETE
jgi:hypothetical protein